MVEYRPLDDEHHEVFFEYTKYAFRPESGPAEYDPDEHETEQMKLGDKRGLFDTEETPRCLCAHYWFDAFIRGNRHPAPGLSAVATPPENRRRGYVERLLENVLEEYRTRGDQFSLLWPFRYRFYRNYGWETCSAHLAYSCEPAALSFSRERADEKGRYRPVSDDEYGELASVYEAYSSRYGLSVTRTEDWWRHRVFEGWGTDPYVYVWERNGEVRGYLTYTIDGEWGDRTMQVREMAFLDHEALLALCAYCANHDSQVSTVRFGLPTDVTLLDLAPDPEDLDCELKTGGMARLVDVAASLSALEYPTVDAQLTLAVSDPLVDWNDGRFHLDAGDGTVTCETAARDHEPDATLDIGALTQLAVGYRSAEDLERTNRLDAPAAVVSTLDTLYPTEPTYLGTRF